MKYIVTGLINMGRGEVVVDSGYGQYRISHSRQSAEELREKVAGKNPGWVTRIYEHV